MKRLNIIIPVFSEQKGFFLSLARQLAGDHNVWIMAKDRFVKKLALDLVPELSGNIVNKQDFIPEISDVITESVSREKKYGEYFSMLMSYDRALGQGYLLNAEKHPHIIKSTWSHQKKLRDILSDFMFYEYLYEKCRPDLGIGHDRPRFLDMILRHHGKIFLSLGVGRIADRYMWFEDLFEGKEAYTASIKKSLTKDGKPGENIEYSLYSHYTETRNELAYIYKYSYAIKRSMDIFMRQTYARLRNIHKRDSYRFCGWIPYLFRNASNYNYIKNTGKSISDTAGYGLVFFALHQEPESALQAISPEFNNSMEIITWISKSIPSDTLLVLKENPWSFGIRSRDYYKRLAKIPNVVWAHPDISSLEWVNKSRLIASITGTVGLEAVYFEKPVLSFGRHQIINHLPTVRYANNFFNTRKSIGELLRLKKGDDLFRLSKQALHNAQMENSFSFPGYEKLYKSSELHMDLAQVAAKRLYSEYPELFTNHTA